MSMRHIKCTKEQIDKWKSSFAKAESLQTAFDYLRSSLSVHGRFLHYTKLSRIYQKLETKRWWLTRADSTNLNDSQEAKKFGTPDLLHQTYQGSVIYGSAESSAMWVAYARGDENAVAVSFSRDAMVRWRTEIRMKRIVAAMELSKRHSLPISADAIEFSDFRDVLYAAAPFTDARKDRRDKNRKLTLSWFDACTGTVDDLPKEMCRAKYTGWLKDYEWRQERESRISIRVRSGQSKYPENLSIVIPDFVLKSMRFTLSPWLPDDRYEETSAQLRAVAARYHGGEAHCPRCLVVRSTLTGALEFWRNKK